MPAVGSPGWVVGVAKLHPLNFLAAGVVDADGGGVRAAADEAVVAACDCGRAIFYGIDLARLAGVLLDRPGHRGGAALCESADRDSVARFIWGDGERRAAGGPVGFACACDNGRRSELRGVARADYNFFGRGVEPFKAAYGDARVFFRGAAAACAGSNLHAVVAGLGQGDGRFSVAG